MPCEAITRGGHRCTRSTAETIVYDETVIQVCRIHQTTFWEWTETVGIDAAIQRLTQGRQAVVSSWTMTTTTTLSTNATSGSSLDGSR